MKRIAIYHDTAPMRYVEFEGEVPAYMQESFERDAIEVEDGAFYHLLQLVRQRTRIAKDIIAVTDAIERGRPRRFNT